MSDWTEAEYLAILTHKPMPVADQRVEYHPETVSSSSPIDWRNHNGFSYVNNIKDQGSCGSCWAFSTNAALETEYAVKKGQLYNLSE